MRKRVGNRRQHIVVGETGRGDCGGVGSLLTEIRKIDRDYYEQRKKQKRQKPRRAANDSR
jgi:hypothetical protein